MSARTASSIVGLTFLIFVGMLFVALGVTIAYKIAGGYRDVYGEVTLEILGAGLVVGGILVGVFAPYVRSRRRIELAAGYTTEYPRFNQVDGISPKTGLVVRPAVVRVPTSPALQALFTSGVERGAIETGRTALGIDALSPAVGVPFVLSILVLVGGPVIAFTDKHPSDLVLNLTAFAWVAAICVIVFAAVAGAMTVPERFYVGRLAEHFPAGRAFSGVLDDTTVVPELLGDTAQTLPKARARQYGYVVVEGDELVFYSRNRSELLPFLTIPRERITSSALTTTTGLMNTPFPSAALSVTKDNGTQLGVTIRFGATRMTQGKKTLQSYATYVIDWARGTAA